MHSIHYSQYIQPCYNGARLRYELQWRPFIARFIIANILLSSILVSLHNMLPFELIKDTPYLALSGELWSVFYEYVNRNWSCYRGFLLYVPLLNKYIMFNILTEGFHSLTHVREHMIIFVKWITDDYFSSGITYLDQPAPYWELHSSSEIERLGLYIKMLLCCAKLWSAQREALYHGFDKRFRSIT